MVGSVCVGCICTSESELLCGVLHDLLVLCGIPSGFPVSSQLQKYASRWIGYNKLSLVVYECVNGSVHYALRLVTHSCSCE